MEARKHTMLLANGLKSYREAIAKVIRSLRPDVEVHEAEPEVLDREVARLSPNIVVCSRATFSVRLRVPVWVELYPECEAHSVISIGGETTTVEEIQLSDILSLLDETQDPVPLG
jgi:hypothetical protein